MGFFNETSFPYQGNTLISLSGGRSSAAMLRLLLDQYSFLPETFKVVFTNTGKEAEATYTFLQRISGGYRGVQERIAQGKIITNFEDDIGDLECNCTD